MIHALNPYPAMKDSGVPWLGQVPEHWDVVPALAAYKSRGVKNTGMVEKTVLSLSYGRIVIKPEEKLRGLVPESFETYQIVEPGNIIVRTTDLQNDKKSLRIGHAKDRGIITSAYMCLETTDRVLNEFGYQYLNAYDLLKIIYGYGSGLRQNLDFKDIRRMPVLVPSHDEQAAIVRYLDHADRRIRRTIAAKQKLIKLLQEQKQVIIHQAVTRGLDPDVKLKLSGVEWLGDVPEGWEVKRLKSIARIRYGLGQPPKEKADGLPLIRATNVDSGKILEKNLVRVDPDDVPKSRNAILKEGEIIVVRSGAYTADSSIIPMHYAGAVAGYDMVVSVEDALPEFIALGFLASYVRDDQLIIASMRSAQPHLNADELGSAIFFLPSKEEQQLIVRHMDRELKRFDELENRAQQEISLLREYRTRLIADVVTGKLDVRAAAAQLPALEGDLPEEGDVEIEADLEGDEPETEPAEALA